MMTVTKRDGNLVEFKIEKIKKAIEKANSRTDEKMLVEDIDRIASIVENKCERLSKDNITVEQIQDFVEDTLLKSKFNNTAKAYILYRDARTQKRGNITDKTFMEFLSGKSEYWNTENSNKNATLVTCQRDYLAGIASTDLARRFLLPYDVCKAHDAGIIHQHDMDYMAQLALHNCCLCNLEDILQNGTVINGIKIDPQNRLLTAATVATQVITAVASSQYGGTTITLTHLAPFVRKSYKRYLIEVAKELEGCDIQDKAKLIQDIAKSRLQREIKDAVQTFNYQVNSMSTTNGQAPFLSVCMYLSEDPEYTQETAMLIEEFLKQRILGMKNEKGVYITPAFPKLLYVLEAKNITEDAPYWYLTRLAAECTAKRMVPDYISEKVMKELKDGDVFPCMGCRSFLSPDTFSDTYGNIGRSKSFDIKISDSEIFYLNNIVMSSHSLWDLVLSQGGVQKENSLYPISKIKISYRQKTLSVDYLENNNSKIIIHAHKPVYYSRFNMGVTTINLADVAFSSKGNFDKFWKLLEERCELCHKGLQARIKRLESVTSDVAPILWQNGALARLDKGESLYDLLHHGYSTASLGFAGLYECVKYMTGHSHTDEGIGEQFGLSVMQKLNDFCEKWKKEEDIGYSVYGTPIESGTYKFAKALKARFGDDIFIKLDGKDRNYITNSYHVPVFEKIDAFNKLRIESKFQKLATGGAVSYIETADLSGNIDAVLTVIKFIYDNIMYAELNTKLDYCQVCGYDGEIQIDDNLEWYCPNCGNRDHSKLNVARRTCGYIGTNFWNYGRTDELKNRFIHLQ